MTLLEMRPGLVKGVVRTQLSLARAQALVRALLVSWPSALHTQSGHRDLRVGLFGKPHADTHEVNHLARGRQSVP